jgi:hypothetical protein
MIAWIALAIVTLAMISQIPNAIRFQDELEEE